MMKALVLAIALFASNAAFAAGSKIFTAVLEDKNVQAELAQYELTGIKQTGWFRCIGCYAFEVTAESRSKPETKTIKVTTGTSGVTQKFEIEVTEVKVEAAP
jgi:hypothetical protein